MAFNYIFALMLNLWTSAQKMPPVPTDERRYDEKGHQTDKSTREEKLIFTQPQNQPPQTK